MSDDQEGPLVPVSDMADALILDLERIDAEPGHPMHVVWTRSTAAILRENGLSEDDIRSHLGDRYRYMADSAAGLGAPERSDAEAEVERFVVEARLVLWPAVVTVDRPDADSGEWFVDVEEAEVRVHVSYRAGRGWGLYGDDVGYGDRPTEIHDERNTVIRRVRERLDGTPPPEKAGDGPVGEGSKA